MPFIQKARVRSLRGSISNLKFFRCPWRYGPEELRPTEAVADRCQYKGPCGQQSAYPSTLISVLLTGFRYFSFKVATQLSSRGWVDPVPEKNSRVQPGFEPGTSQMAVRRANHYTKQAVCQVLSSLSQWSYGNKPTFHCTQRHKSAANTTTKHPHTPNSSQTVTVTGGLLRCTSSYIIKFQKIQSTFVLEYHMANTMSLLYDLAGGSACRRGQHLLPANSNHINNFYNKMFRIKNKRT